MQKKRPIPVVSAIDQFKTGVTHIGLWSTVSAAPAIHAPPNPLDESESSGDDGNYGHLQSVKSDLLFEKNKTPTCTFSDIESNEPKPLSVAGVTVSTTGGANAHTEAPPCGVVRPGCAVGTVDWLLGAPWWRHRRPWCAQMLSLALTTTCFSAP